MNAGHNTWNTNRIPKCGDIEMPVALYKTNKVTNQTLLNVSKSNQGVLYLAQERFDMQVGAASDRATNL